MEVSPFLSILFLLWYVCLIVQSIFSYGTAYRLTKRGGDNGMALCGWRILLCFASVIPGLGIYLWIKYKDPPRYKQCRYEQQYQQYQQYRQYQQYQQYPLPQYPSPLYTQTQHQTQSPEYPPAPQYSQYSSVRKCQNCGEEYIAGYNSCPHCGYQPPVN